MTGKRNGGSLEGFTVQMALVDALPVLFFAAWTLLIGKHLGSALFFAGAVCMALGGLCKVVWKLLLGLNAGDARWLNKAFLPLMAGGFLLMAAGVLMNLGRIRLAAVWAAVTAFPSVLFFAVGLCLLLLMGVLSKKFDKTNARDNWRAQWINAAAQGAILLGVLFI